MVCLLSKVVNRPRLWTFFAWFRRRLHEGATAFALSHRSSDIFREDAETAATEGEKRSPAWTPRTAFRHPPE
jgi:hypothetical protein